MISTIEHLRHRCSRTEVTRAAYDSIPAAEQVEMDQDVEARRFAVQLDFLECEGGDSYYCLIYSSYHLYNVLTSAKVYTEEQHRSVSRLQMAQCGAPFASLSLRPSPSVYDDDFDFDDSSSGGDESDSDGDTDAEMMDSEERLWCSDHDPDWVPLEEEMEEEEEEEESGYESCSTG